MRFIQPALFLILFCISIKSYSQCSTIRQQRNITFNTDKDCAPVTVTDFTITYFFNVPQDPSEVSIQFAWNDPGNTVETYSVGDPQFSSNATNTEFTATGTFTYPGNDDCAFFPESSVILNGVLCETSRQTQVVTSWAPDNDFGGVIDIAPGIYDVCYGNAVTNAIFEDNSTFNCNIYDEPDNPNRLARHTQFVYGTNHDGANSIRNLTLEDENGNAVALTDNNANLSSPETINGVTGTYFGEILEIPFPADDPQLISLPISAPADPDNLIGNSFEITLFNWNACNPYNGDPDNPNYADAVEATAYITIVPPPDPDFQTRESDASGPVKSVFCLGQNIYFENLSTDADSFTWEFYDDTTGTTLLNTSSASDPTYLFDSAGDKLIRLYAYNGQAQGNCEVMTEKIIRLSPAAVAQIGIYDDSFSSSIDPVFCSEDGTQVFTIGFRDETYDVEPETEWRWEFYDETGDLAESIPPGDNTFGASVTDFTRNYSAKGEYLVKLIARNSDSECTTTDERMIYIYDVPEVYFGHTEVCEGERSVFFDIPGKISALNPRVNGDSVALYEWDFSYDGSTFNREVTFENNNAFEFYLDGNDIHNETEPASSAAGTYAVALRMTTAKGMCSDVYRSEVVVNPLPDPVLDSDYEHPLCPEDPVTFINNSNLLDADYQLIITDHVNYYDTVDFNQTDSVFTFDNPRDSSRTFDVTLFGISQKGCQQITSPIRIEVLPSSPSGFRDANYSIVSGNCSVWESTLEVNQATRDLNPEEYMWTITGPAGILPGYPVVKQSGDADFHRLNYTINNSTSRNQVYTITLEVIKEGICIIPSQNSYVINPQPSSTFDVEETDACEYKTIRLEAVQKGLAEYHWEITPEPDELLNEDDVQTLIYLRRGPDGNPIDANFSLVTENMATCRSDTSSGFTVVDPLEEPLVAHFQVDKDTLVLPDNTLSVTNNSSSYQGVSYHWDFGNGQTSTEYNPGTITYSEPGIYEIILVVNNRFCEESFSKSIVVEPADPLIDFSADNLQGCAPLTVNFTNESEYAEPGTFYWEFGDGRSSPADNPSHTYGRGGTYTVTLYGENSSGNGSVAIKEHYIEVFETPVADFSLTPATVYVPDNPVYFRNSSERATAYHWDFGDGNNSEDQNPVHYYESEGTYDITLVAMNEAGCADTLTIGAAVSAVVGGNLKTPNAFSPSSSGGGAGEGVNDVFIPKVEGVTQFRMLIYNKWGQLLFESRDQQVGWDGYYKGTLQPSDVYVYKLELTYSDGRQAVKVGDVTLVR